MSNNKSRTYNSIRNILYLLGNQFLTVFLNFFSRSIFIFILGKEYLGINGLFSDVLMMLSLADLGLGSAMVYSFYKPLVEKDERKISALITFYDRIYKFIALAVTVIGLCIVPLIDFIVELDKPIPYIKLYYILFLMNSVISYLFVYKTSILQADQKSYIVTRYTSITTTLKILLQIGILLLTHNYVLYLLVQILTTFINNFIAARKATKLYPYINKRVELDKKDKNEIFDNIKSVFLYKVSGVLLNGTDNILISKIVGTIYVGFYSNYYMLINSINNFITIAFRGLSASVGNLVAENDYKKRYEIFNVLQLVGFFMGTVCSVCIFSLMNEFINIWVGKELLLSSFTLIAIVVNFYMGCVLQPIWSYREATGLFKKMKYIMSITATINILLSIILGTKFGIGGIIISTAISKLSTYCWYEPMILYNDYFKKSSKDFFIKQGSNIIFVIVLSIIFKQLSSLYIVEGWIGLFIKAAICFILASLIFILVYCRTTEFKYLLNKFRTVIKK